MEGTTEFKLFQTDKCTQCGECFHQCPVLQLPKDEAINEIKALINQENGKYVLTQCHTCFSCNLICPQECHPYQLILMNWNRIYHTRGAPPIYRFVCPTMDKNIWQMLYVLMPKEEKNIVSKWMDQPLTESILLIGNYTHLFSFVLSGSKLLTYFTPVSLVDHWETGAYLYQGGYLDVVKRIGANCKKVFDDAHVKTIVPFMDAVQYIIQDVQAAEMGNQFTQKVLNFNEWLLQKIDAQEILLPHKLPFTVTVHDNCYSKTHGEKYWTNARRLIGMTGCKVVEMEHHGKLSTCCGFGAGASWTKNIAIPFQILAGSKKKFEEAQKTGADALVTYCGGCLYLLWAAKVMFQYDIKVFHQIELVRAAMGEPIDMDQKQHVERAWDIIAIITYHLMLGLGRRPFQIEKISFSNTRWKEGGFLGLRLLRSMLKRPWIQKLYRKFFLFLLKRTLG